MNKIIKTMEEKYVTKSLDMIRRTFTNLVVFWSIQTIKHLRTVIKKINK